MFSWIDREFRFVIVGALVFGMAIAILLVSPTVCFAESAGGEQVNVTGKPETWFGTSARDDIGQMVDCVALPPDDPKATLQAHDGKVAGAVASFTFKTPKAGKYAFTFEAFVDQGDAFTAEYRTGETWVKLPPARIQPDFLRDWDLRKFSYWIDIPAGQTATRFRISCSVAHRSRVRSASISMPRIDKSLMVPTDKHPYLLFCREDLPRIRRDSKRQPTATFRKVLEKAAGDLKAEKLSPPGRMPSYRDRMEVANMAKAALAGMLNEDANLTASAKKALLALSSWETMGPTVNMAHGGVLRNASLTYDLLYDELSVEERQKVETFLAAGAEFIIDGAKKTMYFWNAKGTRAGNWRATIYSGLGMVGMVLWDKHPEAPGWVAEATDVMKACLDYDFDADGAAYESYVRYFAGVEIHSILPTMEALRRVTGEDLFERNNRVLQRHVAFTAYMMYPTFDAMPSLGDTGGGLYSVGLGLTKAAQEYKDPLAAWYLDRLIKRGWTPGPLSAFSGTIWGRPEAMETENPDESPRLAEAFAYDNDDATKAVNSKTDHATGHVFLRTGFSNEDDIYFMLQAGDNHGFHAHADQGGYVLAAYGVKFLRDYFEGSYSGERFTYRHSGLAHHTVLVDGHGQGAELQGLGDIDYFEKVADIEAFESHKGYDYVRLNLLKAYRFNQHNRMMQKAMRHVVFVRKADREGFFVIIDDLQKDDQPHTWSQAFHYEPEVKPSKVEGGKGVTGEKGGTVILSNPKASLHIRTFADGAFKATGDRKFYDGFVLLTCTRPMARFTMVTVLYPVKAGGEAPKITAIEGDGRAGVEIEGIRIAYDKSAGTVSVDGALSDVTARNGRVVE